MITMVIVNTLLRIKDEGKKNILPSTFHKIYSTKHVCTPQLPFNINWLVVKMRSHLYINNHITVTLRSNFDIQGPPKKCIHTLTKEKTMLFVSTNFNYTSQVECTLQ